MPDAAAKGPAGPSLAGLTVLVVDDEADARQLVEQLLRDADAEVHTAASAAEALILVESVRPDVLLSDIGMPECDGYEFIRQVRALAAENGGRTPAVALTAFARTEDRIRTMVAGYQVHLAKPVEPDELLTALFLAAAVITVAAIMLGAVWQLFRDSNVYVSPGSMVPYTFVFAAAVTVIGRVVMSALAVHGPGAMV